MRTWSPDFVAYQKSSCERVAASRSVPGSESATPDDPPPVHRITPPRLLTQVRPVYPPEAFEKRIEGTVELEILIGATGDVEAACVIRGKPGLDAAAVNCVRQWKFTPAALEDGKPVPTVARAPVTFRIF
jgi:TonB family protein